MARLVTLHRRDSRTVPETTGRPGARRRAARLPGGGHRAEDGGRHDPRRRAARRSRGDGQRRSREGSGPRRRLGVGGRERLAGRALCAPHAAQAARLHRGGGRDARPRHRRHDGDLQRRRRACSCAHRTACPTPRPCARCISNATRAACRRQTGGPGSWIDYVAMRDSGPAFAGIGGVPESRARRPGSRQRGGAGARQRGLARFPAACSASAWRSADSSSPTKTACRARIRSPIISHAMWQTRFAGATDAIGRTLLLNGVLIEIVGVTETGLRRHRGRRVDVWLPSSMAGPPAASRRRRLARADSCSAAHYVARLAPGLRIRRRRGRRRKRCACAPRTRSSTPRRKY